MLEDADVVKAIVEYINRTAIEVLILGAAAKGGLLRYDYSLYACIDICTCWKGAKNIWDGGSSICEVSLE